MKHDVDELGVHSHVGTGEMRIVPVTVFAEEHGRGCPNQDNVAAGAQATQVNRRQVSDGLCRETNDVGELATRSKGVGALHTVRLERKCESRWDRVCIADRFQDEVVRVPA